MTGVIPVALLNKYTGPLSFIKSTSGKLSDTCIKIAFNHIERLVINLIITKQETENYFSTYDSSLLIVR